MSPDVSAAFAADKHSDRRAPRQRAFLRAKLSYPDGSISFECSVVQISATGAKLALTDDAQLPERFRIEIPQRRIDCLARAARRDADSIAVAFDAAEEAAPAGHAALLRKIQTLEAENRALQGRIKTLTARLEGADANY